MQLARIIQLPDHLTSTEKLDFLQDVILYLHDQLEETESVPQQRAFGFIGTTSAIAITWSLCGMGMIAPVVAIPGAIIVAGCSLLTGITLAKDVIEAPELVDLQKRLVTVLESKEVDQWVKLWEERGTESFLRSLQYACNGGFTAKGAFRHKSGSHPFDVAALFGRGKAVAPWEKQSRVISPQLLPPITPQQYSGSIESVPTQQIGSMPMAFERPSTKPVSVSRSAYTLILDNPFQSLAIFGAQRTGKSYLAAILSQELHRRNVPVYAINLARFGEEDDVYWSHCVKSVMGDVSEMRPYEANQLIEQAIDVVEEFYAQKKAILIFDEWAYAGGKNNAHAEALEPLLKLVADKLSVLTSTGIKRGRAIWTIAPEFVAKDLQPPALAIKKSKLLYVTIAPNKSVDWNGNEIKFDDQLFGQVKHNYTIEYPKGQRFNQDRICYLNKEWIEMGDLPPLDPSLRPSAVATQPQSVPQQQPVTSPDYSEQDRTAAEAEAVIVAALRSTPFHTLWEFGRDELGLQSSDEIKRLLERVGEVIFDYDLTELKEKFRLQSKYGVRYSYAGYSKKVAATHRKTGNVCALCHESQSEEAHHIEYLGIEDEPGKNLYALCKPCHHEIAHSRENWQQLSVWKSRNTPEFEARLKLEYQFALVEGEAQ